jgi:hypothetical protein
MTRRIILLLLLAACTSCTELAILSSGAGIAVSHNAYARAYSGIDFLTIMRTEKDIKTHIYHSLKEEKVNGDE